MIPFHFLLASTLFYIFTIILEKAGNERMAFRKELGGEIFKENDPNLLSALPKPLRHGT